MQAAIIRWVAIGVLILLIAGYGLWQRGSKEAAYRALDTSQAEARTLRSELGALSEQIADERAIWQGQGQAGDDADQREQEIQSEYDERLAAALAGRDRDNERLREQWGQCATAHLSARAAAAGEFGRQDELRRASIARVLRHVASVQSERDETVDRYQAVYNTQGAP